MMDELAALRLQMAWGADEALGDLPLDRLAPATPVLAKRAPETRVTIAATPGAVEPQADTLDGLFAEWEAFAHPLRATATHTVRPDGNEAAGLVLIGDAPGSDDDRSGRAFSGANGLLLDRVMASAGFSRSDLLLTTLVPWRPPGNRPLTDGEIQSCLPFVRRLIGIVRPLHVLLLGAAPARALTTETGTLRRLRGRWLNVYVNDAQPEVPAMVFPAIEQWLHNPAAKQQLWSDLLALRRAVTSAAK